MYESNRQTLSYGHIISFSPPDDRNSYVFCDGFISNKTVLKSFQFADPNCKFLDCLFQIYPSFLNSGKKAALGLKKELQVKYAEASEQKKRELIQETLEKVSHEYKFNQDTFDKLKDTAISFDTPVQFLHITSNKFLACNFEEEANYEKENFKLELTDYPSENTFLKFLPVYTYQKRNDGVIYVNDTVHLVWSSQYLNKTPYIHISSDFAKHKIRPKTDKFLDFGDLEKSVVKKVDEILENPKNDQSEKVTVIEPDEDEDEMNEEDNSERKIPGIIGNPSKSKKKLDFDLPKIEEEKSIEIKPQTSNLKGKSMMKSKIEKNVNFQAVIKKSVILTRTQQNEVKDLFFTQDSFEMVNSGPKKEINVSLDSKSLWKIQLIRSIIDDKNILCYGDIVWLNYSQKNSTLIAKYIDSDRKEGRYKVGFVNSMFSEQQNQNFQGDTNGMWMIEHEDCRSGGMIEWKAPLRLKHLISGKYLSVGEDYGIEDQHDIVGPGLFEMVTNPTKHTLFEFTILPTTINKANPLHIKCVPKEAFMKLKHCSTKHWIKFNHERGGSSEVNKGNDKKTEDINTNTELIPIAGDETAFKIFKANETEIWETNFLISSKPFLFSMLHYLRVFIDQHNKYGILKDNAGFKIEKKIKRLIACLKELNMFSLNEILNTSPDQKYGYVNSYRQKLMKELGFINICIDLLRISLSDLELEKFVEYTEHKKEEKKKKMNEKNIFSILGQIVKEKREKGGFFDVLNKLEDKGNKLYNLILENKVEMVNVVYTLLTNICKNNVDNESYVHNLFSKIQYQAKYLKCATDCIISVISDNEGILNNIADSIKINKDASEDQKKDIENNLIYYFLRIAEDQTGNKMKNKKLKNCELLKFFRSICKYQGKGMSGNQEILHKLLLDQNQALKKAIFLPIKIVNQQMSIEFVEGKTKFLDDLFKEGPDSVITQEHYSYLLEQLNFFSDLALGRNYLWKTVLEKIFPINFVFSQISEEKLSKEMRSAFCNLALSLYVDHEPRNLLNVPNMCRVYVGSNKKYEGSPTKFALGNLTNLLVKKKISTSPEKKDIGINMLEQSLFEYLIEQTFKYINDEKVTISNNLSDLCKLNDKGENPMKTGKKTQIPDYLNNILTLDIIRLSSILIRFDVLRMLDQSEKYAIIIPDLVSLLEFYRTNPEFSYVISKIRDDNLQKNQNIFAKNFLLGGFKNIVGNVFDNFTEISKSLVGAVFFLGSSGEKSGGSGQGLDFIDYNDPLFYKTPLMRGLISIRNKLELLNVEEITNKEEKKEAELKEKQENDKKALTYENSNDILIKMEICELLIFFGDLRIDFLITNFLKFFEEKLRKLNLNSDHEMDHEMEIKIGNEVEEDGGTVIPPLLQTGIFDVDLKYKIDSSLFNVLEGAMDNVKLPLGKTGPKKAKVKKFQNYTEEAEMPDLDSLMGRKMDGSVKSEILPSLILGFFLNKDPNLENKILEVIMKCFNQRKEFTEKLIQLEILFDPSDIKLFQMIQKKINMLRTLTERSEIWISNFMGDYQHTSEIKETLDLLLELNSIFYVKINTEEDDENKNLLNLKKTSSFREVHEEISKTRQNIYRFVKGYLPLINLIKDSQNQIAKIVRDNKIPLQSRKLIYEIMKTTYFTLKNFCTSNDENQRLLFPYLDYFLDELQYDFGQTDLVNAIFKNNQYLCENCPKTFEKMKKIIKEKGRQKRFLEFFRVIQKVDETDLLENQLLVVGNFLPITVTNEENASLLYGTFVDNSKSNFQFDYGFQETPDTRDEPFYYHAELINVFSKTLHGSEASNINLAKVQEIFRLKYLLPLLLERDDLFVKNIKEEKLIHQNINLPSFYEDYDSIVENGYELILEKNPTAMSILKPAVLDIIFLVYLNPAKISLERIYKNSALFIKFFQLEDKRLNQCNNTEDFTQSEIDYIFGHLLKFLKAYQEKIFAHELNSDINDREDKTAINSIFTFIEKNLNNFKGKLTRSQITNVTDFFLVMKGETKEKIKEEYDMDLERSARKNTQKKEGNKLSGKWDEFFRSFLSSSILEKELKNEQNILGEALVNITKLFTPGLKKSYKIDITFQDILQKLINFMNYGLVNKAGKQTMIYVLELLENIICNATDITEMQNLFDKFNATKMFLNLISDSKVNILEDDLLNQLLSFMIKLLEGGNSKVQKTIFNFFTYYDKSEKLFWKFHSIIAESIKSIKETKKTINSSIYNLSDHSTEMVEKENLKSMILMKTLRLLQLFTEGHNLDLQNYVREQTNSRNKYDMVSIIVELLETYHKNLNVDNYENYTRCLDTLTEFVQGPCPSNQQSIIDGKFLEIANSLMTIKGKKKDKKLPGRTLQKRRTFNGISKDLEYWMLQRLRHKCMILVMSLVELRKENSVIKRIIRSLPLDILKDNIIKIYKRYKNMYQDGRYIQECLKHFEGDPTDKNQDKPIEHYELILETGFYIYFLILHYLDIDIKEVDTEISDELQEIELNVEDSAVGLFKNNIVTQILDFVRSLLESVLHYANYIKTKIWKFQFNNQANEKVKDQKKRELYKEAIQFFSKNSAHIEVVRNEDLERVHFFLLPSCHYLPKETKNDFHDTVNRTSAKSKVTDLVDNSKTIIEISKHEETLDLYFSKNKIFAIFAQYVNLWKDLSFICAILLNIVIICSYGYSDGNSSDDQRLWEPSLSSQVSVAQTKRVFFIVGICMSCFSVFVVIFYVFKKAPLVIKESWNEDVEEVTRNVPKKKKGFIMTLFGFLYKIVKTALKLLNNFQLLYYLAYGATALIGVLWHEFFFTFHMTEIMVRYPYIIKAVWEPKKQLFLTLILFILIEYFFTVIAYVQFSDYYAFRCENIYMCFFETFDQTFKDNGGIAQLFEKVDAQKATDYYYGRFFFDNAFNIVLVIVLINIVAGIIIDKFGSLREKENEKMKDIESICFICGHTKETFDRRNDKKGGFTNHIKKDHYMWNYLFYIAYLKDKDETEYTGIESYVSARIKKYDCSWFPINRAIVLKNFDEDEDKVVHKQLIEIEGNMSGIKKSLKDLSFSTTTLNSKMNST